jgi:hypothetical protein
MSDSEQGRPSARRPTTSAVARSRRALERELIRIWRVELQARGFTDRQAARLIYTKLLFLRGRLRG